MSINIDEVGHIADLARLDLTVEEKQKLVLELGLILEYVAELGQVDTAGVDLNLAKIKPVNQTREDREYDSRIQGKILEQAPKSKERFFVVRQVL